MALSIVLGHCDDHSSENTDLGPDSGPHSDTDHDEDSDSEWAKWDCEGPWMPSGAPCTLDVMCQAGLLCDETLHECRPISGITLLDSYDPTGRVAGSDDDYSEGLDFAGGSLWQSTPQKIFWLGVSEKAVLSSYPTPSTYGEGLTWHEDILYHVSYHNNNLYAGTLIANELVFEIVGQLNDPQCTYGIVAHCAELYASRCGDTAVDTYLIGTTDLERSFVVRDLEGREIPDLEDLEIYRGELWTSSFTAYRYTLFRIDLRTFEAIAAYPIPECRVIDGVAIDDRTRTLYVSGKNCPISVYQVD